MKALINGDDVLLKYKGDYRELCKYLASYGCIIECENWVPRHVTECVFLSHQIMERYVQGFGDFYVAGGNLDKLLSSLNWVKSNKNLTFEESCVAHLVGLRMCLFPWHEYFEMVDEILETYISRIVLTEFSVSCLSARFTEREMAFIHTRAEDAYGFLFSRINLSVLRQVLKGPFRLFKIDDKN